MMMQNDFGACKNRRKIICVSGAGVCSETNRKLAYETGREIARQGHILLNGGLYGVMEASAQGAKDAGGLVVGILPGDSSEDANAYVDIPIVTNMGHARNIILMHTADSVIALEGEFGTLSEIAVALKLGKRVVGLGTWDIPGVMQALDPKHAVKLA